MRLQKTHSNSQFCRFHSDSTIADDCLTKGTPKINGKEVEVLQLLLIPDQRYDVYIEFVYVNEKTPAEMPLDEMLRRHNEQRRI